MSWVASGTNERGFNRAFLCIVFVTFYVFGPLSHHFAEANYFEPHAAVVAGSLHDGFGAKNAAPGQLGTCDSANHCQAQAIIATAFSGFSVPRHREEGFANHFPDRVFMAIPSPPPRVPDHL